MMQKSANTMVLFAVLSTIVVVLVGMIAFTADTFAKCGVSLL
jgi:hypothetical protein